MSDIWSAIRDLSDDLERLRKPDVSRDVSARVYSDAALTIPNNALTAMTFNTERYDTAAFWDAGAPTRLTIPVAGKYLIGCTIIWTIASGGRRLIRLRAGGATSIAEVEIGSVADGTAQPGQTVVTIAEFAASGYVEALAFQTSGGNLDIIASAALSPEFWIQKVG